MWSWTMRKVGSTAHRQCASLGWVAIALLIWALTPGPTVRAGEIGTASTQRARPHDPCLPLLRYSAGHVRQILDVRLRHDFPITAQLQEGHGRLSAFAIRSIDCERQRVIIAGSYEFRGNIGVMDLTRRGTAVIQLHMTPQPGLHQVVLEDPEVLDMTFDNPAPWFDGKAVSTWSLELFATPRCATLQDGLPC